MNPNPTQRLLIVVVAWLIALTTLTLTQAQSTQAYTPQQPHAPPTPQSSSVTLNTALVQVPDALAQAMLALLKSDHSAQRVLNPLSASARYVLTSARLNDEGDWALISVAADGAEYLGSGETGKLVIGKKEIGDWRLALEINGDLAFAELVQAAPDAFISPYAKQLLLQTPNANLRPQTVSYKWPWLTGLQWHWWQGFHGGSALDIGTAGSDRRVLASAGGVITYMCKGPLGAAIKIRDEDGLALEYWHIDAGLLADGITLGATVAQGQVLGSLRPGTWTDTACGPQYTGQSTDNAHLHWVLPKDRPFIVEGWTITYPTSSFSKEGQTKTCNGGCWNSQIFFASSNTLNGSPTNTPAPTKTATATATATPTPTATPKPGPLLLISPDRAFVKTGSLMTLTVALSRTNALELAGVQFEVNYSPTLISVQAVAPGEILTGTTQMFSPTLLNISNTLGVVSVHLSSTHAISQNTKSDGVLLNILAQANATGLAEMQFASVHLTNTTGTPTTTDVQPSSILILDELPSPRAYLPMVLRLADGNEPTATPTATDTVTPTPSHTPTVTPTSTPTLTATPTQLVTKLGAPQM